MYESLLARLPRELVVEIVLFEGRVTVANETVTIAGASAGSGVTINPECAP